ncbi:hypothetical protein BS17DRAFT_773634 [Gyrodon lividus]|nr:hypothetical protein BS17DRAFT_773634 [Gyrodon lividus]
MEIPASCEPVTPRSSCNSNPREANSSLSQAVAPGAGNQTCDPEHLAPLSKAQFDNNRHHPQRVLTWGGDLVAGSTHAVPEAPTPALDILGGVTTLDIGHRNVADETTSVNTSWWSPAGYPCELVATDVNQASGALDFSQCSSFQLATEAPQLFVFDAQQPAATSAGGAALLQGHSGGSVVDCRCLWKLQDGSPCQRLITGSHNDVVTHIRRTHGGLPSTRSAALFRCHWGSCQKEIKSCNLPRHIIGHAGIRWRCSGCDVVLSRKDYAQRHIKKRKEACRNAIALLDSAADI